MPVTAASDLSSDLWSSRSELERLFGALTISRWADLDGKASQVEIESTVQEAIATATDLVRSRLRGTVAASEAGTSKLVRRIVSVYAGDFLYTGRGIQDSSDEDGRNRLTALINRSAKQINQIISGQIRLESSVTTIIPESIDLDEEEEEDSDSAFSTI